MYISKLSWGADLTLLTIFDKDKLHTPELLQAIIDQNKARILTTFNEVVLNNPLFQSHIQDNTVFYDAEIPSSVITPVSGSKEYFVKWYTEDNMKDGVGHETILLINGTASVSVIKEVIKTTYPKCITNTDGSVKDIFVIDYTVK